MGIIEKLEEKNFLQFDPIKCGLTNNKNSDNISEGTSGKISGVLSELKNTLSPSNLQNINIPSSTTNISSSVQSYSFKNKITSIIGDYFAALLFGASMGAAVTAGLGIGILFASSMASSGKYVSFFYRWVFPNEEGKEHQSSTNYPKTKRDNDPTASSTGTDIPYETCIHEAGKVITPDAKDVSETGIKESDYSTNENDDWSIDTLAKLETNLDDTSPEVLGFAIEKLLKAGAIDAWVSPIVMKKGRPAHTLHCLCHSTSSFDGRGNIDSTSMVSKLLKIIFHETTTLGIRIIQGSDVAGRNGTSNIVLKRVALQREFVTVQTPYIDAERDGRVSVKVGYLNKKVVSVKAEFDHCRIISQNTGIPLKQIANYAQQQIWLRNEGEANPNNQEE